MATNACPVSFSLNDITQLIFTAKNQQIKFEVLKIILSSPDQ